MTVNDNSEMAVDQWLAIRKEEALKIDPSTAEVDWIYALTLDPYGVYPDQRNTGVLAGYTLHGDLAVTFGWSLAICQRRPAMRFGNGINQSWRFLPDLRNGGTDPPLATRALSSRKNSAAAVVVS